MRRKNSPRQFQDVISGECFKLSTGTLRLLPHFQSETSVAEVATAIGVKGRSRRDLAARVRRLRAWGLLVTIEEASRPLSLIEPRRVDVQEPSETFFGCPFVALNQIAPADIAFFGVPFDLGSTAFPGARYAPERLRRCASDRFGYRADIFSPRGQGTFFPALNRTILAGAVLRDVGDLYYDIGESYEELWRKITRVETQMIAAKALPVTIGGDHSITYALVRAFRRRKKTTLVQFDAHGDLAACIRGFSHNHANFCRRLLREELVTRVVQMGGREDPAAARTESLVSRFPAEAISARSVDDIANSALSPNEEFYLSLDIDVLDPSFAPGVGTPSPFGLTPAKLDELFAALLGRGRLVGFDLVEINPMLDRNNQTVSLGCELLLRVLARYWERTQALTTRVLKRKGGSTRAR